MGGDEQAEVQCEMLRCRDVLRRVLEVTDHFVGHHGHGSAHQGGHPPNNERAEPSVARDNQGGDMRRQQ